MALDNITVMLFLAPLTLELCAYIPINPVLLIAAEVCAANLGRGDARGGAAEHHHGNDAGVWFQQFPGPYGAIRLDRHLLADRNFLYFAPLHLRAVRVHNREELERIDLPSKIKDRPLMKAGLTALAAAIFLLIFHLTSVGLAALLPALALMVYEDRHGRDVMHRMDLESLVFFMGLFVIVGGLIRRASSAGWLP